MSLFKRLRMKVVRVSKDRRVVLLTSAEREVFVWLCEGYTLKECADMLSIKYSTVKTHAEKIYKKLGVRSRAELIIIYHSK